MIVFLVKKKAKNFVQRQEAYAFSLPAVVCVCRFKRLIVVLEHCWLESAKVGRRYELLNCDDHRSEIGSLKKDYADYRPGLEAPGP